MKLPLQFAQGVALVWAGVGIGGSLIATPAKFQAPSLTLTTALEVGRAQFFWVGVGEWVLCAVYVAALVMCRRLDWRLTPVLIFAAQRLALMPVLDARTLEVIAGHASGGSQLHVLYICVEVLKIFALFAAAIAAVSVGRGAARVENRESR